MKTKLYLILYYLLQVVTFTSMFYFYTLMKNDNVICTYHRAYDTNESELCSINMCIDSIEAFLNNKPINLI